MNSAVNSALRARGDMVPTPATPRGGLSVRLTVSVGLRRALDATPALTPSSQDAMSDVLKGWREEDVFLMGVGT